MTRNLMCKLLQRKTYDVLGQKYSILFLITGVVILTVAVLHFGETVLDWSKAKYSSVFYPFSDNIGSKSYQKMLCQHVPIDVVYSWVNGTDPNHLRGLSLAKSKYGFTHSYSNSCILSVCIESNMVLVRPQLSDSISLSDLEESNPLFEDISRIFTVSSSGEENVTVLVFTSLENASQVVTNGMLMLDGKNYSVSHAFLTDNWLSYGTVNLKNTFIISGVPSNSTKEAFIARFPINIKAIITDVLIHSSKDFGILVVSNGDKFESFLSTNSSIVNNNKTISIIPANLVVELPMDHEDISASRFADNEELRYSLRSLEKHAPWVKHIYIVTNGQIPYWLNLDSPRVSIITHEEIFPNKSHLPTYSSPAIECHLHRIPNLSQKFLYLNDDVMFGKNVWPEDFYTHTKGQRVYLSWPVPNCAEGCPSSWIRDGYCDKPCNNSFCQWDGGDCTSDNPMLSYQGVVIHPDGSTSVFRSATTADNCHSDCVNNWLSDRYCDRACNVKSCAFDAGDCGTSQFDQLALVEWKETEDKYQFPEGETVGYINITSLLKRNFTIMEGFYDNNAIVRSLSISLKYSVLCIVLYPHFNKTKLVITLKGTKNSSPFEKLFYLTVKTKGNSLPANSTLKPTTTTEDTIVYEEFKKVPKKPKVINITSTSAVEKYSKVDVNASNLPDDVLKSISVAVKRAREGELTEKGFYQLKFSIINSYVEKYNLMHKQMPALIYNMNLTYDSLFNHSELFGNQSLSNGNNETVASTSEDVLKLFPRLKKIVALESSFPNDINATMSNSHQFNYETPSIKQRNLLDTFGDSLRHVNKLYNEAFGYEARKVPSHIAHFVDKGVMDRLYNRFNVVFDVTSSHKIRRSDDMQFAFSYYYYLMSEIEEVNLGEVFDFFDVDGSRTWSDREIRTLLTRLHDLPLDFSEVKQFEQHIINCSTALPITQEPMLTTPHYERFYDTGLPTVTKSLVLACKPIANILKQQFGQRKRNNYEVVGEEEVSFKMIHNNLSHVLNQIDDIRKNPKKFICLNDNMKHGTQEAELIRSVIQDFYESLFPTRSQFELPPDYRNRFLYMEELQEWRRTRDLVRYATYISLTMLILFSITSFWKSEVIPRFSRHPIGHHINRRSYQV